MPPAPRSSVSSLRSVDKAPATDRHGPTAPVDSKSPGGPEQLCTMHVAQSTSQWQRRLWLRRIRGSVLSKLSINRMNIHESQNREGARGLCCLFPKGALHFLLSRLLALESLKRKTTFFPPLLFPEHSLAALRAEGFGSRERELLQRDTVAKALALKDRGGFRCREAQQEGTTHGTPGD